MERLTGLSFDDICRIGLTRVVGDFQDNGRLEVGKSRWAGEKVVSIQLRPLLTLAEFKARQAREDAMRELINRCVEIDEALELKPGHGIAETLLGGLVEDIERGDYGLILSGWEFDDELGEKWASEKLAGLAASWKAEGEGRAAA